MKKILLAIKGGVPREEAARYALGLAQRLRAKVEILQVINPGSNKKWRDMLRTLKDGAAGFEAAMAAAAFAEAGEPKMAENIENIMTKAAQSLTYFEETGEEAVDYNVTIKIGDIEKEIVQFVENNRDAVVAVYDGPSEENMGNPPQELHNKIPIPLVSLKTRNKQDRGENMSDVTVKKKSRVSKFTEKMDQYHEAVTYAEANMPEEAIRVLERIEQEPPMLLVVGRGHTFSKDLKEYAIGLAGRLKYEIVAVNTKYIPNDFLPLVTPYRDKLREDFTVLASEAAGDFQTQCEDAGVVFHHITKFGEATDVIRELHREFKRMEYVLTEPDENVERAPGAAPAIPVFSLAFF